MTLPTLTEAEFQLQVIDLAHLRGWKCAHFRSVKVQRADGQTHYQTPVMADGRGFPDLLLLRGERMLVVELKVGRNTCSDAQTAWLLAFRAAGMLAVIWRPEDWPTIEEALA